MGSFTEVQKTRKILLSGVFGPYGVDDEFGRKENIMELYHNQVTKAQGPASFRFHHRSFGLYFIAANIDADVTVLDFPTRKRFAREVEKGDYDMVGISFIMPNVDKAREMARIVREKAPDAEIILGGHGAAIEGVEQLIDCDHVVKGEGIRWMREHLGQDPDAPIHHPALPSAEWMSILGVPLTGARIQSARTGGGLCQRLQLLLDLALFRQALHPLPRLRQGPLRDRLPSGRRAGHRQLLRHGRELPQGP